MKNLLLLLAFISLFSCQQDDVKNTYTISGKIGFDDMILNIEGLVVTLYSQDHLIATQSGPEFSFTGLEEGKDYTIVPTASGSKNGISTLDIVLINKYLDGTELLDPFQLLAADFNVNGSVTNDDPGLMADCIVNEINCASYRFVTTDYDGTGQGSLDNVTIEKLMGDKIINFYPVKIGDVNNTIHG